MMILLMFVDIIVCIQYIHSMMIRSYVGWMGHWSMLPFLYSKRELKRRDRSRGKINKKVYTADKLITQFIKKKVD